MAISISDFRMAIRIDNAEARKHLQELDEEMKKLRAEMTLLEQEGKKESEEYKAKKKALDELKPSYALLRKEGGLLGLTYNELRKGAKMLKNEMDRTIPNTEKWRKLREEYELVNNRLRELRGQAQQTGLSLAKLSDGFNRYAGMAAAAVASMTGVALTARRCVDEYSAMEEAMSQVRKYTGLTTEEVKQLNEEMQRMDTRTPREKLNALAGDAGRLGITGRKEIMDFVEAANIINVALGEDLGEDAVKNMGKLATMFGEDKQMGLRGAMLATASAINEVAQNSSAAEGFLTEFTARVAGVGKQAGLTQADIIGFAASMDENMLRNETSATAYQKILMKMFTDTAKFANAAGLDLQEFARLVKTDANEAMLQFAEALSKKGGLADLAPIFGDLQTEGAGVASVLSVMAGKADDIRARQALANEAYRQGTSVLNEYEVQNNTVQAGIDKAKKAFQDMRIELGERLMPSMKYMISTGSLTVKMLAGLVSFAMEYHKALITLAVGLGTYRVAVQLTTIVTKAMEMASKAAAMGVRAFDAATKTSGIAALVSVLASGVAYLAMWVTQTKEETTALGGLQSAAQQANNVLAETANLLQQATGKEHMNDRQKSQLADAMRAEVAQLEDLMVKEKTMALQWYNEQKERYKSLLNEGDAKRSIKHLEKQLAERLHQYGLYKVQRDKLLKELATLPAAQGAQMDTHTGMTVNTGDEKARQEQMQREQKQLEQAYNEKLNIIKLAYIQGQLTEEEYQQQLYEAESAYLLARKALMERYGEDTSQLQGQIYDRMIAQANKLYAAQKQAEQQAEKQKSAGQKESLDQLKSEGEDRVRGIKQQYLDGEIDSHQAMMDAVKEAERQNLEERIALMESYGMDASQLRDQLMEEDIEAHRQTEEQKTEETEKQQMSRSEIASKAMSTVSNIAGSFSQLYSAMQDRELSRVEKKYDKEIAAARKAGKDTTKLEEQKEAEMNAIKKKYADKQFAAQVLQVTASTAVAAMEAYKAMAGIPIVGPVLGAAAAAAALMAGAIQIASAKQQRDEAKGLYTGGYSEGYTATGDSTEEAGVIPVHKNEFVANHEAVANPAVRQFLDVFDAAQKNGTIRMINTTQILERVRMTGRYEGGYTSQPQTAGTSASWWSTIPEETRLQLVQLMKQNNELLEAIRDKELNLDPRKLRDSIERIGAMERRVSR